MNLTKLNYFSNVQQVSVRNQIKFHLRIGVKHSTQVSIYATVLWFDGAWLSYLASASFPLHQNHSYLEMKNQCSTINNG